MGHDILNERVKVDRSRIEEAFFPYALLMVASWYPNQLSPTTLSLHAKTIDGNMKNHRAVCSATHAGYIEYKDLPGRVQSGCQNSPAFESCFYVVHKPPLAMPQRVQIDDNFTSDICKTEEEPVGNITNKRTTRNSTLYQVQINFIKLVLEPH